MRTVPVVPCQLLGPARQGEVGPKVRGQGRSHSPLPWSLLGAEAAVCPQEFSGGQAWTAPGWAPASPAQCDLGPASFRALSWSRSQGHLSQARATVGTRETRS